MCVRERACVFSRARVFVTGGLVEGGALGYKGAFIHTSLPPLLLLMLLL